MRWWQDNTYKFLPKNSSRVPFFITLKKFRGRVGSVQEPKVPGSSSTASHVQR